MATRKSSKPKPNAPAATAAVVLTMGDPVPVGIAPSFHITGFNPGELIITQMTSYIKQDWQHANELGQLLYVFFEPLNVPGAFEFFVDRYGGGNRASVKFTVA